MGTIDSQTGENYYGVSGVYRSEFEWKNAQEQMLPK